MSLFIQHSFVPVANAILWAVVFIVAPSIVSFINPIIKLIVVSFHKPPPLIPPNPSTRRLQRACACYQVYQPGYIFSEPKRRGCICRPQKILIVMCLLLIHQYVVSPVRKYFHDTLQVIMATIERGPPCATPFSAIQHHLHHRIIPIFCRQLPIVFHNAMASMPMTASHQACFYSNSFDIGINLLKTLSRGYLDGITASVTSHLSVTHFNVCWVSSQMSG